MGGRRKHRPSPAYASIRRLGLRRGSDWAPILAQASSRARLRSVIWLCCVDSWDEWLVFLCDFCFVDNL